MGDYRKLEVWTRARSLSDRVDAIHAKLPRRVQNGLGDQLVRAAQSIHLNIAEGCGLDSDPQLIRHLRIALGSANELEDGLEKLNGQGHIPADQRDVLDDAGTLRRKLGAFIKRVRNDVAEEAQPRS